MLIFYPNYYLVPVTPVTFLYEDEYIDNTRYTFKKNLKRQRNFTLEELSKYNGIGGNPAYVSVNGVVYDVSSIQSWAGGAHFGVSAGIDATKIFSTCHAASKILDKLPKVGVITG
ncbi:cytochrome b5 domain-containing protein [Clostridium psychrophilum]|uniref:cytochrome b5 domain-containing protein n=1 Tax=Clostridium psychrophilum TaxID=132926 RepID=UPI001FE7E20C|nr:cytochrome b5 domain-containing protein [Clostridium psychrophilum]